MRIIAEVDDPKDCKDCAYLLIGTPRDSDDDVYVCPLIGLDEVSGGRSRPKMPVGAYR